MASGGRMKNKYPFQIASRRNEQMFCHELQLLIGGFSNKEEAEEYAKTIVEFLELEANATAERVQ
jgi:hypothetical protein